MSLAHQPSGPADAGARAPLPWLPPTPLLDEFVVNQTTLALRQGLQESCQQALEERRLGAASEVDMRIRLLEGDPARELNRLAKEEKADLLVMGSTGVSGLAGNRVWLHGPKDGPQGALLGVGGQAPPRTSPPARRPRHPWAG